MKKSTSRLLYLIGAGILIVGAILLTIGTAGAVAATNTDPTTGQSTMSNGAAAGISVLAILAFILMFAGGITIFISWIGAVIKTAQLQRWGWFWCLLLLSGVTILIYIFAGPETPAVAVQGQQPYYPQSGPYPPSNQPPYPPSNQPSYPQGPYPPQQ